MPTLEINSPALRETFELADPTSVGRQKGNTIVIRDEAFSRRHCEFVRENGAWYVVDLGSTNGVKLNGVAVTRQALKDGDVLVVGGVHKMFFRDAAAAAPKASIEDAALTETDGDSIGLDFDSLDGPDEISLDDTGDPEDERAASPAKSAAPRASARPSGDSAPPTAKTARAAPTLTVRFQESERTVTLTGPLRIGRKKSNDLVLADGGISGAHAEIIRESEDWVVIDLDSTNGVTVNAQAITRHRLRSGDRIMLGEVATVIFFDPSAPSRSSSRKTRPALPAEAPAPSPDLAALTQQLVIDLEQEESAFLDSLGQDGERKSRSLAPLLLAGAGLLGVVAALGALFLWKFGDDTPADAPDPSISVTRPVPASSLFKGNHSFEQGAGAEDLPGWWRSGGYAQRQQGGHSGRWALLFEGAAGAPPECIADVVIPASPGKMLRLSAWLRSPTGEGIGAVKVMFFADAEAEETLVSERISPPVKNAERWTEAVVIAKAPANARSCRVAATVFGPRAAVLFDDFTLEPSGEISPASVESAPVPLMSVLGTVRCGKSGLEVSGPGDRRWRLRSLTGHPAQGQTGQELARWDQGLAAIDDRQVQGGGAWLDLVSGQEPRFSQMVMTGSQGLAWTVELQGANLAALSRLTLRLEAPPDSLRHLATMSGNRRLRLGVEDTGLVDRLAVTVDGQALVITFESGPSVDALTATSARVEGGQVPSGEQVIDCYRELARLAASESRSGRWVWRVTVAGSAREGLEGALASYRDFEKARTLDAPEQAAGAAVVALEAHLRAFEQIGDHPGEFALLTERAAALFEAIRDEGETIERLAREAEFFANKEMALALQARLAALERAFAPLTLSRERRDRFQELSFGIPAMKDLEQSAESVLALGASLGERRRAMALLADRVARATDETRALAPFSAAEQLMQQGMFALAEPMLRDVATQFPKSQAAQKARSRLAAVQSHYERHALQHERAGRARVAAGYRARSEQLQSFLAGP